jgi:dihydrolipoamide dehydrogenase
VEVEHPDGTRSTYRANVAVVVATGTRALIPPIEGIEQAWDTRDVTTARRVPRRLLVVGGGVAGVEMAQAWRTLGSEDVTVVELQDRLLPTEEPFAGEELAAQFARDGIEVLVSAQVTRLARVGDQGPFRVEVESSGNRREIEADEVAVAVGRRPNTDDIGLDTVGLEPGGFLDVDDRLRVTGVEGGWLYAVGDVNGRALLTHSGKYQARIAGAYIAGLEETRAWADQTANPRVVFTHPQVAAVGLTEATARDQGLEVRTVTYDTGQVAGSATLGEGYRGTAKLVVDSARQVVVGATFVSPVAGEMLHAATIAVVAEVPLGKLWHAIPAFPTVSEVWLRLLEAYRDEYGHTFV